MTPTRVVVIDSFPDSVVRYIGRYAIVCIDVLTTCTTLLTSLAQGRRTYVAASSQAAASSARELALPLMAGEVECRMFDGFELPDSPAAVARRTDVERPLVLFSLPGCELIVEASAEETVTYVGCMRNLTATAEAVAARHTKVALLGAGHHGSEFSCEDQMATARIASQLLQKGYQAEDLRTSEIIRRWRAADPSLIGWGNGANHLQQANRAEDVDFVIGHHDDLPIVCRYEKGEVMAEQPSLPRDSASPVSNRRASAELEESRLRATR